MTAPRWIVETCVVAVLFGVAMWWGTAYWNASLRSGRQPVFYQQYFEPAVLMACGRGFVISHPQFPAMADFLERRSDRFSCGDIPPDNRLGTDGLYQGMWRYLLGTTALFWRLSGVSWSGLGPLCGLFFAATIALGYGILRLGMGRLLALVGAVGLSISTVHLLNLPHLRDYSKAPFTLALILILGLLVKARPARRAILGCAAAYGVVLGIGYGFRTDFLVNIPVFFFVLFVFVDGGLLKNLPLKVAAGALCLTVFVVTAWPIVAGVVRSGGCQWHTAILGLTINFTDALELDNAPYDFGHAYADGSVFKIAKSYERRVHPDVGPIPYCSHDYDVATGDYLAEIARRFPADVLTRAYASAAHVTNLPFSWLTAPLPGFWPGVYDLRTPVLAVFTHTGVIWVAAAIAVMSAFSLRLALFLGFFVVYFGGYPAIQFSDRHYFHLEIIAWWAFGFVVHQSARVLARSLRSSAERRSEITLNWRQAAWVLPVMLAVGVASLSALRIYQGAALRGFFTRYVSAPVDVIPLETLTAGMPVGVPPAPAADKDTGEAFIVVTLNAWQCGDRPSVTFRYDKAFVNDDFTRTFTLAQRSPLAQPTRIFAPVYSHFLGVEFSDTRAGCIGSVARVRDLKDFTLLVPSVLPPDWEHEKLYQRFKAWPWTSAH